MVEELKNKIDRMSYRELLVKWRFAPVGHSFFQGEIGDYFKEAIGKKRKEHTEEELMQISKDIGW